MPYGNSANVTLRATSYFVGAASGRDAKIATAIGPTGSSWATSIIVWAVPTIWASHLQKILSYGCLLFNIHGNDLTLDNSQDLVSYSVLKQFPRSEYEPSNRRRLLKYGIL